MSPLSPPAPPPPALHETPPRTAAGVFDPDARMTVGQRAADRVAAFGGSWTFVLLFVAILAVWMMLNGGLLPRRDRFDPYPFILLNLVLSTLAALQAPIIMMSQNRQADKDRLAAAHDFEVNVLAEAEVRALNDRLDRLDARLEAFLDRFEPPRGPRAAEPERPDA